jgi:ubiquinol-cytochrome c reductase cytochrome b subunit
MGWLEGALRMFPNWTWDIGGHTVAWNVFVPALVVMGVLMTALAIWPQLERWATGDKGYHHVNDRPRNAPTRTAFGMAGVTFFGILWLEGANDIIAVHFNIDLYTTTEIARYAIFIGPVVAFWITRRICIGLQRKDAQILVHGVETGIIRQLPNGAFVEAERPVDEEEAAILIAKPPAPQLPAASAMDSNGVPVPEMRGLLGKVRSRVNALFAEGISLAPPPPDGHGNGHAEDVEHAEGEHVAVGAGSSSEPGHGGHAAVENGSGTHGDGV